MASKCGCAGGNCSCRVIAGRGAKVRGSGTQTNPLVIDALPMSLTAQSTTTVDLTLTGDGTAGNPWVLKADVAASITAMKWGMWVGTQAEYDALGTYDPNTLYGITGP